MSLTKRQKQVLGFIRSFTGKNDYAPTFEEIAHHLGLSSISTAHYHVSALEDAGYLSKEENQPRSIDLVDSEDLIKVPLLGTIAAGQPIEVAEGQIELITIPKTKLSSSGSLFALRVDGESMIEENISNGDIVVVKSTPFAENGEKVVALINNSEATLKKFFREGDRIRLQPANAKLAPIYVNLENLTIQGKVVSVIHTEERDERELNALRERLRTLPLPSTLFPKDSVDNLDLKNPFLNSHLITYIGNKRSLLPFLYQAFMKVRKKLGNRKMIILDGFVGSGAVARLLKSFANELHVNDLEDYVETLNSAYLANESEIDPNKLEEYINWLNKNKLKANTAMGFIEKNYAPKNDNDVQSGERVFYTNTNARIIDNLRRLIDEIPQKYRRFCLASLLVKASIHTNTSGVFKGFHKHNGNGHFGGSGENALSRIKKEISLDIPIFSDFECPVRVHKRDLNKLVRDKGLPFFDLVYYDPPYNQHPYGSNYFMLNIINGGKPVEIQDGISGIAKEWNRSAFNKKKTAEDAMDQLLADTRARFIAISYNNEGIIPINSFKEVLSKHGEWELMERDYNTYRGSRNLRNRDIKVREQLWILEKK